jgi:hypothetical protein
MLQVGQLSTSSFTGSAAPVFSHFAQAAFGIAAGLAALGMVALASGAAYSEIVARPGGGDVTLAVRKAFAADNGTTEARGGKPCWDVVNRRWVPHGAVVNRMSAYGPTLSVTTPRSRVRCENGAWVAHGSSG